MDIIELEENTDTFVFIHDNQEEVQTLAQEELKKVRKGNSDINLQLERDIEMLAQAIVCYGILESDKIKARTLLKSILFLYFGDICYRDVRDNTFHSWNELNAYCDLDFFPIASSLLHGSRVLIEFPFKLAQPLIDWLITDKSNWRFAATHGIVELAEDKQEKLENGFVKHLKEVKLNTMNAVVNMVVNPITVLMNSMTNNAIPIIFSTSLTSKANKFAQHYGIDLALGGEGNKNFFSNKYIRNNGEHGHLYIHCYVPEGPCGILLGIEQSAPGKNDQYGGIHDTVISEKDYSASGGDFFYKKPRELGHGDLYIGLTKLPIAAYYDSLWNTISNEDFLLIQDAYKKANSLLDLLSQNESLTFIKEILSSSGKKDKNNFNKLFMRYIKKVTEIEYLISQKEKWHVLFEEKNQQSLKQTTSVKTLESKTHFFTTDDCRCRQAPYKSPVCLEASTHLSMRP